ncbi:hypothetical protein GGR25_001102 [Kaistia hirudinis]|uniref:Uncharacterized protein n=1 Tax=Kaistia hirudinis TaxID=1293440 RepID=A0A840ALC8_9HYPH|nr:hypothetical protein [Kaistia hirudinis]
MGKLMRRLVEALITVIDAAEPLETMKVRRAPLQSRRGMARRSQLDFGFGYRRQ